MCHRRCTWEGEFPKRKYGANSALGAASGRYEPLMLPEIMVIFLVHVSLVITTYSVFGTDTALIPPGGLPASVGLFQIVFARPRTEYSQCIATL